LTREREGDLDLLAVLLGGVRSLRDTRERLRRPSSRRSRKSALPDAIASEEKEQFVNDNYDLPVPF